ncbi:MAG: hypothetical protein KatS3mg117_3295 [Geminicoccaceae bacterium]|nr:MAG: hypothetical protein KatS3mg117_3295 [Geminicoccaceae bacterium]
MRPAGRSTGVGPARRGSACEHRGLGPARLVAGHGAGSGCRAPALPNRPRGLSHAGRRSIAERADRRDAGLRTLGGGTRPHGARGSARALRPRSRRNAPRWPGRHTARQRHRLRGGACAPERRSVDHDRTLDRRRPAASRSERAGARRRGGPRCRRIPRDRRRPAFGCRRRPASGPRCHGRHDLAPRPGRARSTCLPVDRERPARRPLAGTRERAWHSAPARQPERRSDRNSAAPGRRRGRRTGSRPAGPTRSRASARAVDPRIPGSRSASPKGRRQARPGRYPEHRSFRGRAGPRRPRSAGATSRATPGSIRVQPCGPGSRPNRSNRACEARPGSRAGGSRTKVPAALRHLLSGPNRPDVDRPPARRGSKPVAARAEPRGLGSRRRGPQPDRHRPAAVRRDRVRAGS